MTPRLVAITLPLAFPRARRDAARFLEGLRAVFDTGAQEPTSAPAPSAWRVAVVAWGVAVSLVSGALLQPLMRATGLLGAVLLLILYSPLILVAGLSPWRSVLRGPALPLVGLVVHLVLSGLWSRHVIDAMARSFNISTVVVWLVIFLRDPGLLGVVQRVTLWFAGPMIVARIAGGPDFPLPSGWLLFLVMYRTAAQTGASRPGLGVQWGWVGLVLAVMGAFVGSTFRTPVMAGALGLGLLALRCTSAKVALVLGLVVGGLAMSIVPRTSAPSYSDEVERGDLVARYETIGTDRLSGRQDIWQEVLERAAENPDWVVHGVGVGDTDYEIAECNPRVVMLSRGERVLHSHNVALELFVTLGVPGLLWLAVIVIVLARHTRWTSPSGAFCAAVASTGIADVVFLDVGGGTIALAAVVVAVMRTRESGFEPR